MHITRHTLIAGIACTLLAASTGTSDTRHSQYQCQASGNRAHAEAPVFLPGELTKPRWNDVERRAHTNDKHETSRSSQRDNREARQEQRQAERAEKQAHRQDNREARQERRQQPRDTHLEQRMTRSELVTSTIQERQTYRIEQRQERVQRAQQQRQDRVAEHTASLEDRAARARQARAERLSRNVERRQAFRNGTDRAAMTDASSGTVAQQESPKMLAMPTEQRVNTFLNARFDEPETTQNTKTVDAETEATESTMVAVPN